jgi:hypothetical protein
MKNRKIYWLLTVFFLVGNTLYAQRYDDRRMKIELQLKVGKETIVSTLSSASVTFTTPYEDSDSLSKKPARNFILAMTFEKADMPALRAFIKNKNGVDGAIILADSFGKMPSRKIGFTSAVLDGYTDQFTNEYSNMYFTIKCVELVIDDLKMEI